MRTLICCALVAALMGCRSSRSEGTSEGSLAGSLTGSVDSSAGASGVAAKSSKRDYYSANRTSRAFLRDSMRVSRKLRREELKVSLDFSGHYDRNKELRRSGRKFTRDSFWIGEWRNFQTMWSSVKRELHEERQNFRKDVRFGHLDSGE